jgi:hypothetical protein
LAWSWGFGRVWVVFSHWLVPRITVVAVVVVVVAIVVGALLVIVVERGFHFQFLIVFFILKVENFLELGLSVTRK